MGDDPFEPILMRRRIVVRDRHDVGCDRAQTGIERLNLSGNGHHDRPQPQSGGVELGYDRFGFVVDIAHDDDHFIGGAPLPNEGR